MNIQLAIAIISAFVALASVLLTARAASSNTRSQAKFQRELAALQAGHQKDMAELQARLQGELERRREEASKASRLEEVVSRYRDPLLNAAFELQSRIYNFAVRGFASYLRSDDPYERNYAVNSTLFVIAQYLGWAEALRRGVQFLDLGDIERNRDLVSRLETVRETFSTDSLRPAFRIFRIEQRAIGELMLDSSPDSTSSDTTWNCTGYAAFCSLLEHDQAFASWFDRLRHDIAEFATNTELAHARFAELQSALMDLIDFLDDPPIRFPAALRSRISYPLDSPPLSSTKKKPLEHLIRSLQ